MNVQFRSPSENDRSLLEGWIREDPDHPGGYSSDVFYDPNALSMIIGDKEPVFFLRLDPMAPDSVKVSVQFGPNRLKNGKVLLRMWPVLKERVKAAGIKRMVYESESSYLVGFCNRCFGFTAIEGRPNWYELRLEG